MSAARRSGGAGAYLRLARPHHWIKNGFVFTGLLFGHAWQIDGMLAAALLAAAAFCLMSSAVYAINDCIDRARDREHPGKRARPVASGEIGIRSAWLFAALLAGAALCLGWMASSTVAAILAAYAVLNLGYSLGLKRIPVLDVSIIASGFMLRILAGTLGLGIEPSRWLLFCGFLLTLFLGFAKRRAELAGLGGADGGAGRHRPVLESYSLPFLDAMVLICAGGSVLAYGLYTVSPDTLAQHGAYLTPTLPWVLFGVIRYLYRLHRRGGGGDPATELLRDPWMLAAAAGWLATVLLLIG
jgi:4-hydroxybenzoate polyprenyltransferase